MLEPDIDDEIMLNKHRNKEIKKEIPSKPEFIIKDVFGKKMDELFLIDIEANLIMSKKKFDVERRTPEIYPYA